LSRVIGRLGSRPDSEAKGAKTRGRISFVTPGLDPGAQVEAAVVGLGRPILDARVKPAHDAEKSRVKESAAAAKPGFPLSRE